MAGIHPDITSAFGNTPLVRLNRVTEGLGGVVLAKLEFYNPVSSVKDRLGIAIVDAAEASGELKPGGTIIEPTSGNTGHGLVIAAALKGYRCIFVMADKQSAEKQSLLRAYGAEVVLCPTNVEPESPESYYSVARRLARDIPGAFQPDQYWNMNNPLAHEQTTGPEIWRQTEGAVTHVIIASGTGGTISGVGHYLKSQNPAIQIIGADPEGSVLSGDTARPYLTEGIGEDFFPGTMDLKCVDDVIVTPDKDCFLMTRKLATMEGILTGGSGGSAVVAGLEYAKKLTEKDFMVILVPDTGMRYLSKIYNDEWMKENQYFESEVHLKVADILASKRKHGKGGKLATVKPTDKMFAAMALMRKLDISQLPVFEKDKVVGTIMEDEILGHMLKGRDIKKMIVREAMTGPLPVLAPEARVESVLRYFTPDRPAVLIKTGKSSYDIVTKYDVVNAVSRASEAR